MMMVGMVEVVGEETHVDGGGGEGEVVTMKRPLAHGGVNHVLVNAVKRPGCKCGKPPVRSRARWRRLRTLTSLQRVVFFISWVARLVSSPLLCSLLLSLRLVFFRYTV